jgi:hypothetical protein
MPPKAKTADNSPSSAGSTASGKLLIIGILIIALASAAISWWFRYNATHRSAEFWGPETARLIRDAPVVMVFNPSSPIVIPSSDTAGVGGLIDSSETRDVSQARGLVHLRTALLEDHNFDWPPSPISPDVQWKQGLIFRDEGPGNAAILLFSPDLSLVNVVGTKEMLSCAPISKGLREMFGEFSSDSAAAK